MNATIEKVVLHLVERAKEAEADDALRLTQAAVKAAQAGEVLCQVKRAATLDRHVQQAAQLEAALEAKRSVTAP